MQREVICVLLTGSLLAQTSAHVSADLQFEVASLKPSNRPLSEGCGIRPAPGGQRYEARNCPIKAMIQVAHYVKPEQIVGGPSWVDTERFDMDAKAEKPSSIDELHVMLVNMLADRLHRRFTGKRGRCPSMPSRWIKAGQS